MTHAPAAQTAQCAIDAAQPIRAKARGVRAARTRTTARYRPPRVTRCTTTADVQTKLYNHDTVLMLIHAHAAMALLRPWLAALPQPWCAACAACSSSCGRSWCDDGGPARVHACDGRRPQAYACPPAACRARPPSCITVRPVACKQRDRGKVYGGEAGASSRTCRTCRAASGAVSARGGVRRTRRLRRSGWPIFVRTPARRSPSSRSAILLFMLLR